MTKSTVSFLDATGATEVQDSRTNALGEERPTSTIGNDGSRVVGVEPWAALSVSPGYTALFYDAWSGTVLDTVDRWVTSATPPTLNNGDMTLPATVSTYNWIKSRDTIKPNAGFTYVANGITLAAGVTTGMGAFWGLGIQATTPAPAVLVQDGIGFEIDQATGALLAVTYAGGVRTTVATLTRPTDGAIHRYATYSRATAAGWYIDDLQVPVAEIPFPNLDVAELPALMVRQNAATLTGAPVFVNLAHLTADTSHQASSISDAVVGTRMARVTDIPAGLLPGASDRTIGAALNVNPNAIQKATYRVNVKPVARANTADTFLAMMTLHHTAASTKTIRLRKVTISGSAASAAGLTLGEVHKITAVPTGTAVAAGATGGSAPRGTAGTGSYLPVDGRDPAGEATVLINGNTVLAATPAGLYASGQVGYSATAAVHAGNAVIYDWPGGEERRPLTARAGVLEGWVIGVSSSVAMTWTATIEISFTEE